MSSMCPCTVDSPLLVAMREDFSGLLEELNGRTAALPRPTRPEKGASSETIVVYEELMILQRFIEAYPPLRKRAEADCRHREREISALLKDPATQMGETTKATYEAQLDFLRGRCTALKAMEDELVVCYREALMNYNKTFTDHRLANARRSLQAAYGIIQQKLSQQLESQSSPGPSSTSPSSACFRTLVH